MPQPYEWAVLRVVPRIERGEHLNAGVVVYCGPLGFLRAAVALDPSRALALDPHLDVDAVRRHLAAVVALCDQDPTAGPNGQRGAGDRFRWLVAPRSTVVQASPVHTGLTDDPATDLDRLLHRMVLPPDAR